jgi:hypothetical protein
VQVLHVCTVEYLLCVICVWHAFAYTLAGLGSGMYTKDTAGGVGEVCSIGHGVGEKR